jgi:hypothetical protein
VQNQTNKQWDQTCVIKNHCNDDAFVKPLYTKTRLQPNETRQIVLNVYLPANFKSEKIVLLFQLENAEGERFGDPMIGIIDVDLPLDEEEGEGGENRMGNSSNLANKGGAKAVRKNSIK